MATAAKVAVWVWGLTPGPFRKSQGALMALMWPLRLRSRKSEPSAESAQAAFGLAAIDVPTTGQIEGYKHLRLQ